MRISIVHPLARSGGNDVVGIYARYLAGRGHHVVRVSPAELEPTRLSRLRARWFARRGHVARHEGIEHRVLRSARPIVDSDLPDADVVVATWWETAEWVGKLSPAKGQKVHFVQGHEVYRWLPQERARAVHRLPMHRIAVSRWLADVLKAEHGVPSVDVVLNGIDHKRFHGSERGRQTSPTVGLLASGTDFKGFRDSIQMLDALRVEFADLKVLAFGLDRPGFALPDFVSFERDPPPDRLPALYRECDVWLSASTSEGFNLPVVEAMACRTPVVAFATGWSAEGVRTDENGVLVPVGDWGALQAAVRHTLALPDGRWRKWSQNAAESVAGLNWTDAALLFEDSLRRATRT